MSMTLFRFGSTQCTSKKVWWMGYAIQWEGDKV